MKVITPTCHTRLTPLILLSVCIINYVQFTGLSTWPEYKKKLYMLHCSMVLGRTGSKGNNTHSNFCCDTQLNTHSNESKPHKHITIHPRLHHCNLSSHPAQRSFCLSDHLEKRVPANIAPFAHSIRTQPTPNNRDRPGTVAVMAVLTASRQGCRGQLVNRAGTGHKFFCHVATQ
jgi:hypothetical protein